MGGVYLRASGFEKEGAAMSLEEWALGAVFALSAGAAVFLPGGRERAKSMARVPNVPLTEGVVSALFAFSRPLAVC